MEDDLGLGTNVGTINAPILTTLLRIRFCPGQYVDGIADTFSRYCQRELKLRKTI